MSPADSQRADRFMLQRSSLPRDMPAARAFGAEAAAASDACAVPRVCIRAGSCSRSLVCPIRLVPLPPLAPARPSRRIISLIFHRNPSRSFLVALVFYLRRPLCQPLRLSSLCLALRLAISLLPPGAFSISRPL
eukprot:72082-Pleurochrysis_carterae.AAC.4